MNSQATDNSLANLTRDIEQSASLKDIGAAIDRFSATVDYQFLHFGVCKIDNTAIKDIIYSRPISGTAIELKDFSDELKVMACEEALDLMRPYDLTRHDFQTCATENFDELRKSLLAAEIDGVIIIPYRQENTISVVIIRCAGADFLADISEILPAIYSLVAKTFARFPTLTKWPNEYRLTDREAEVLQISAGGARENEIAAQFGLSVNTIRNHVENAKRKLEARNKAHAIIIAAYGGEINPGSSVERR